MESEFISVSSLLVWIYEWNSNPIQFIELWISEWNPNSVHKFTVEKPSSEKTLIQSPNLVRPDDF